MNDTKENESVKSYAQTNKQKFYENNVLYKNKKIINDISEDKSTKYCPQLQANNLNNYQDNSDIIQKSNNEDLNKFQNNFENQYNNMNDTNENESTKFSTKLNNEKIYINQDNVQSQNNYMSDIYNGDITKYCTQLHANNLKYYQDNFDIIQKSNNEDLNKFQNNFEN
jgi:hypothetical protein